MEIAPPQPLTRSHRAKDGVSGARRSHAVAKPAQDRLQLIEIGSKFSGCRAALSLLYFGSGRIPFHPADGNPQRDPFCEGALQQARSRAGCLLAQCHAVTIAKVAEHLMSRHVAPLRFVLGGELREAAQDFLLILAIAECFRADLRAGTTPQ